MEYSALQTVTNEPRGIRPSNGRCALSSVIIPLGSFKRKNMRRKDIDTLKKQLSDYGITDAVNDKNIGTYVDFVVYTFLPKDVQDFVFSKCRFTVFSRDAVATMICVSKAEYLIVIDGNIPYGENIAHTIAHEVAHAWLGHRHYSDKQREEETDNKVKEWGVPVW